MNILLKNGRLIEPTSGKDEILDLLIMNGVIEKMGVKVNAPSGTETIDM